MTRRRKENRLHFKKTEFKQSLERSKSQWGLKFLLAPYVPGPMYSNYLHDLTVKEMKGLNSKLVNDQPKEEKEEVNAEEFP